jgi:hypothetical protein
MISKDNLKGKESYFIIVLNSLSLSSSQFWMVVKPQRYRQYYTVSDLLSLSLTEPNTSAVSRIYEVYSISKWFVINTSLVHKKSDTTPEIRNWTRDTTQAQRHYSARENSDTSAS